MKYLTRRKHRFIVVTALVVVAWTLFEFAIGPALERMQTLSRVIPEQEKTLIELRTKSDQYRALRTALDGLENRAGAGNGEFELVTFLESIAAELHLTQNVTTMQPTVLEFDTDYKEVIVELQLENITLRQLVEFLLKAKSPDRFFHIKSLYIAGNAADPDLLDTIIQISTLQQAA
ncbi:MAG: hypothetical protein ACYTBJ_03110 [Planctomycetota bacterium]|jgi:hypothetical protein